MAASRAELAVAASRGRCGLEQQAIPKIGERSPLSRLSLHDSPNSFHNLSTRCWPRYAHCYPQGFGGIPWLRKYAYRASTQHRWPPEAGRQHAQEGPIAESATTNMQADDTYKLEINLPGGNPR